MMQDAAILDCMKQVLRDNIRAFERVDAKTPFRESGPPEWWSEWSKEVQVARDMLKIAEINR